MVKKTFFKNMLLISISGISALSLTVSCLQKESVVDKGEAENIASFEVKRKQEINALNSMSSLIRSGTEIRDLMIESIKGVDESINNEWYLLNKIGLKNNDSDLAVYKLKFNNFFSSITGRDLDNNPTKDKNVIERLENVSKMLNQSFNYISYKLNSPTPVEIKDEEEKNLEATINSLINIYNDFLNRGENSFLSAFQPILDKLPKDSNTNAINIKDYKKNLTSNNLYFLIKYKKELYDSLKNVAKQRKKDLNNLELAYQINMFFENKGFKKFEENKRAFTATLRAIIILFSLRLFDLEKSVQENQLWLKIKNREATIFKEVNINSQSIKDISNTFNKNTNLEIEKIKEINKKLFNIKEVGDNNVKEIFSISKMLRELPKEILEKKAKYKDREEKNINFIDENLGAVFSALEGNFFSRDNKGTFLEFTIKSFYDLSFFTPEIKDIHDIFMIKNSSNNLLPILIGINLFFGNFAKNLVSDLREALEKLQELESFLKKSRIREFEEIIKKIKEVSLKMNDLKKEAELFLAKDKDNNTNIFYKISKNSKEKTILDRLVLQLQIISQATENLKIKYLLPILKKS